MASVFHVAAAAVSVVAVAAVLAVFVVSSVANVAALVACVVAAGVSYSVGGFLTEAAGAVPVPCAVAVVAEVALVVPCFLRDPSVELAAGTFALVLALSR